MPRYEFRMQRVHVDAPLRPAEAVTASKDQANYLLNVLRLQAGDEVLLFNGRDGEWRATVETPTRKTCALVPAEQTRPQPAPSDFDYLFAPLKHARLDYMVQKAVEMGASRLSPVITRHTQAARVNTERMAANVVEAAEQCGILQLAEVREPRPLADVIAGWSREAPDRQLIFCDEGEASQNPLGPLEALKAEGARPLALLIGPEGGFSEEERALLRRQPFVTPIPLGPRVLRADTAAVAAFAVVQAVLGDWR
ncbi:16S rRNA (uracil(1498)-N(3))-methyltransferase [Microvirga tunisiensis]|uniref:Ribosomal RNA small subunit methyltransferase E n=1 Tax=Pannonibacter tanglangensis TaxID=2750084 RepID=A0A7X5J9L1_9HYPH|nr:16S rRNA (uracil(1498)-N(3))-methyltransferase [Pannonibacter sp. XCT-53]